MYKRNRIFFKTISYISLVLFSLHVFPNASDKIVINKTIRVHTTRKLLWSALTQEKELAKWWNKGVRLEPHLGGEFHEPWGDGQLATGKVFYVKPVEIIRFSWKERDWSLEEKTICEFSIEEKQQFSILKVRHSGWEVFQRSQDEIIEGFNKGWDFLLPKLKVYLESKRAPKINKSF